MSSNIERIEAAIDGLKKQLDEMDGYADGYAMIFDGKHCTTILEALRFQNAALGEPSDEVILAGVSGWRKDPEHKPSTLFKAMIAKLSKQVKEDRE